ncbi:preprotein translocase subunit SecF [Friedmanniella endophytica]|uniref:Protein-export membrane protein SecF n=1 Tax=Microlunatus kandeliicorticis TaxID=1759536 RepID=A0A7W3P6N4_9ACTN|nr:protein translocase subunit SecF [Microlunatus kandeliicorticis]MBA8795147.1 preprotein translocase subunit SecF [Microlunatus kandeliicorticis]
MSRFGRLGHQLYAGEVSYDFIGHRRRWYILSGILIAIAIVATLVRGLNFGIEFRGGADFQVPAQITSSSVERMQSALDRSGVPELAAEVTTVGGNTIRVETRTLDSTTEVPKVRAAIAQDAGTTSDKVAYSLIGASWGSQITERALIALVVFLVLVGLIIWIYFRNATMSFAALVALLHDLIITVGIYALVGFPVTPATVIGVLTILGYSLYDTVVVFDKVRENVRDIRSSTTKTYSEAANLAVNQVLVRSINTTVIGVLPVAALLIAGTVVLGGSGPLQDLSLALFVGMVSGAYSSIFIATPLLAQLKEREPDMVKQRQRVENRRAREAGLPVPHASAGEGRPRKSTRTNADDRAAARDDEDARPGEVAGDREGATVGAAAGTRTIRVPLGGTGAGSTTGPDAGRAEDPRTQRLSDGAAKRPQPEKKPRSQRHT